MTTTCDDPQLRDGPPPEPGASPPTAGLPPWAQEHSATDRELLDRMVACKVAQNQAHAARLDALFSFHARRVEEQKGSRPEPGSGFFQITPLRETQAETAPLTGVSEHSVQIDLDVAARLTECVERAQCAGIQPKAGSELEFFLLRRLAGVFRGVGMRLESTLSGARMTLGGGSSSADWMFLPRQCSASVSGGQACPPALVGCRRSGATCLNRPPVNRPVVANCRLA